LVINIYSIHDAQSEKHQVIQTYVPSEKQTVFLTNLLTMLNKSFNKK